MKNTEIKINVGFDREKWQLETEEMYARLRYPLIHPFWYASWEPKKKKSWIQKIHGYDSLESRLFSAEQMRDHNRVISDLWKSRAVELSNWQSILGRRLKFSVGHNHIEIIIGNPVTVAENFNAETEDEDGVNTDTAYTICSPKDAYNWKTGAIKALENLCHENDYTGDFTAHLFGAMKKKYPEVFTK